MDPELASQIAQIRDVLPDYGDGFLTAALQVRVSVSLIVVETGAASFTQGAASRMTRKEQQLAISSRHCRLRFQPATVPAFMRPPLLATASLTAQMPACGNRFTMPDVRGARRLAVRCRCRQAAGVIDTLLEALRQQAESCMLQTLFTMFTLIADICCACPQHSGGRPDRVIDTLLEGSLPPELLSLDPHSAAMPRPQPPAAASAPTASRGSAAGAVTHSCADAPGHRCEHT